MVHTKENKDKIYGWFTVAPSIIIILLIIVYPLFYNVYTSFRYLTLINFRSGGRFVGLNNYLELFSEPGFHNSLFVTFVYVLVTVTLQFIIAFLIALALYKKRAVLRKITTICLLLPKMITPVAAALIWRFMLNYETGVINYFLSLLHIPRVAFFTHPVMAMITLNIIGVWQSLGFTFLLLVTGLMAMPNQIIEAAEVDGANWFKRLWYIIIPTLKPVILITTLFAVIHSFQVFDTIFMTTQGGPAEATQVLSIYLYRKLFGACHFGSSGAISVIMLIISLCISIGMIMVLKKGGTKSAVN
ncbi:MAG: sugar ABC transporter permease [Firmicutes bacterium]|nr:sugar ABC transporter permease [Bacillota bacterium]